jgi:glycosyltransferase involved in cell wall biosynthesis
MRVLYILGCNEGPSKRYRVFNHIEALGDLGCGAEWIWDIHPEIYDTGYLRNFDVIVNFRGGYNERFAILKANAEALRIPLIYDVDDLVFDDTILDHIDAYLKMPDSGKREYAEGVRSMRRALLECSAVTVSTPFLKAYIAKTVKKPTWMIPFGVNRRQIAIARLLRKQNNSSYKFITYLSGTKTHERDFIEAASALANVLSSYKNVYLKIVGPLDLPESLKNVQEKIIRVPFMRWENLVIETSRAYINIAPFDPESDFCQSKSNLKYIEAGLCGVPTRASPISAFQSVIKTGINGFIATNEQEWVEYLGRMIENPRVRDEIGEAARAHVFDTSTPGHIGRIALSTYEEIRDVRKPV